MHSNFYANIHQQLQLQQDKVLIVWNGEEGRRTYDGKDLLHRIAAIRLMLQKQQIRAGDKVVPALPVGIDLICAVLAIMSIGSIPVLPPARSQPLDIIRLIKKHHIKGIITPQPIKWPLPVLSWLLGVKTISPRAATPADTAFQVAQVPAAQPALISHSSGSTGLAKAIFRSHQVLSAQHQVLKEVFPPLSEQRDFPLFPNILLHNLSVGYTSILPEVPWHAMTAMDSHKVISQIVQEQVHTITGNVFYFNKLLAYLEQHSQPLAHVKALGVGGSPVPEILLYSLKKFFCHASIYVIYGSSEAEPIAVRKVEEVKALPQAGYAVGAITHSLEYKIEPTGLLRIAGKSYPAGEVKVRGAHVALSDKKDWLNTGDFGYIDDQNQLFLTGRLGNERMHQGVMHYQIEHVLQDRYEFQRVAALSQEDGFYVYIEGQGDPLNIRQTLQTAFPGVLIKEVFFREALPVDARHYSKILYNKLI